MIDWGTAGALLAALQRGGGEVAAETARQLRAAPRFQNVEFPLSPFPVAVLASRVEAHGAAAERYLRLLERVLTAFGEDSAVREYFQLGAAEERLARCDAGFSPAIRIARLDGYIAQADGGVRFLENNTDCPAGVLFTERIDRLVDRALAPILREIGAEVVELPLDRTDAARQELLAAYRGWGGAKTEPTIAILQVRGRSNLESQEMAAEFTTRGTPAFVADPRELTVDGKGIRLGGRPADLVWNKVNTVYWNQLARETPSLLTDWEAAIGPGKVCHCNAFAARYVTESKLCTAFLQETEFASACDPDDRELLARVLPWSRKMAPSKRVEHEGEDWDIAELLLARQADFVVKQPFDIRGDGVTIGRSVRRAGWEEAVARGLQEGHVAQEFISGRSYPILDGDGVVPMTTSLDSFMFGGRFCGFGAKAGLGTKVNVFQGGRKVAVRAYRAADGHRGEPPPP